MIYKAIKDFRMRKSDFRRSVKNAFYGGADHLVLPILWLIATPVFIKLLGTEVYGIWMLTNGLFGVGGVLSFGLTDATVKFTSKYRTEANQEGITRVLQSTFTLYNTLGFVSGGIIAVFAMPLANLFNVSPENFNMAIVSIRLGGVYVWARFVHSIFQSALHGFERYDIAARINMALNACTIIINVILVLLGFGLPSIMFASSVCFLVGACVGFFVLRRKFVQGLSLVPKVEFRAIREIMGFGFFTWIQTVVSAIGGNLDAYLLAAFLNPTAVAYYKVANHLARQGHALLTKSSAFLFPFVSTVYEQGNVDRLKRIYVNATFIVLMLSTGIMLPLFLFGESVFTIWMGADFAHKVSVVFKMMCIRYAVLPMGIVNFNYLRGTGMVRLQSIIVLINAVISFSALWAFIPAFGLVGAAAARLINVPLIVLARAYVSWKLFGKSDFWKSLLFFIPVVVVFVLAGGVMCFWKVQTENIIWLVPALGLTAVFGMGTYWGMQILFQRMRWVTE